MSAWKPSESWLVSRGRSPTRSAHPCPEPASRTGLHKHSPGMFRGHGSQPPRDTEHNLERPQARVGATHEYLTVPGTTATPSRPCGRRPEVLGDCPQADAAGVHLRDPGRDRLVDRDAGGPTQLDLERNLGRGSKPLRTGRRRGSQRSGAPPRPAPAHEKQPPRSPGVEAATLERDRLDAAILRGRGQSAMGDAAVRPPAIIRPRGAPSSVRFARMPARTTDSYTRFWTVCSPRMASRVLIKAEVVRLGDREPRDNPRFVVTNLRQTPRFIYEKVYCARGDIEARWAADRPHELLSAPLESVRGACSGAPSTTPPHNLTPHRALCRARSPARAAPTLDVL